MFCFSRYDSVTDDFHTWDRGPKTRTWAHSNVRYSLFIFIYLFYFNLLIYQMMNLLRNSTSSFLSHLWSASSYLKPPVLIHGELLCILGYASRCVCPSVTFKAKNTRKITSPYYPKVDTCTRIKKRCGLTSTSSYFIEFTVNWLNFAAVKFRRLPISLYFAHFNFAFWYLRIFPDKKRCFRKNACSSLIYGLIFKI